MEARAAAAEALTADADRRAANVRRHVPAGHRSGSERAASLRPVAGAGKLRRWPTCSPERESAKLMAAAIGGTADAEGRAVSTELRRL